MLRMLFACRLFAEDVAPVLETGIPRTEGAHFLRVVLNRLDIRQISFFKKTKSRDSTKDTSSNTLTALVIINQ